MSSLSECTPMPCLERIDPEVIDRRLDMLLQAAVYMTPSCWSAERIVAQTKCFDYRFFSPLEATLKFVDEYQRVFRWKWKTTFDSEVAHKKRGIAASGLFHSSKEFSEFWNARVHADILGVDYGIYIATSMETALRRAKQKRLLRAGQMRSEDCVLAVKKRWSEEQTGHRWLSQLPHYRSENFYGLPDQIAHQEYVVQAARRTSNAVITLGLAVDFVRVLPAAKAVEIYWPAPILWPRFEVSASSVA